MHPRLDFWDYLRSAPSLPLNLLHASSLAAKEYDVSIIDLRTTRDWRRELRERMNCGTLFVGITTMVGASITSALKVAGYAKSLSDAPVVFGGPHPGAAVVETLREITVDYVAQGEGESVMPALARAIESGAEPAGIPGVWRAGEAAPEGVSPRREDLADIELMPEPPYGLVELNRYMQYFGGKSYLPMETSRGCNRGCRHCYNSAAAGGWRAQSAARVLERTELLKDMSGADGIYFIDDNFFIDTGRALDIAAGLSRQGLFWQVQGVDVETIRDMEHDTLDALCSMGLTRITMGIESGSDRVRRMLNKKPDAAGVMEVMKKLSGYPVIAYCSFIMNFPGETMDDLRKTINMIVSMTELNPNFRNSPIYQFIPLPGTYMCLEAEKNGFSPPRTLSGWGGISYETGYGTDNLGAGETMYEGLNVATLFCDGKYNEYISNPLIRLLSGAYRSVALFRLRRMLFRFVPEIWVFRILKSVFRRYQ